MALPEFKNKTESVINTVDKFLKDNWAGHGERVNLNQLLPIVVIHKQKWSKSTIYPVFSTTPQSHNLKGQPWTWAGEAIGSERENRVLFVGNNERFFMTLEEARSGQWKLSEAVTGAIAVNPSFDGLNLIDRFNLRSSDRRIGKDKYFLKFGKIKDNISGEKREVFVAKFGQLGASTPDLTARIHTVLWMKDLYERGRVYLGCQSSIGQIIG